MHQHRLAADRRPGLFAGSHHLAGNLVAHRQWQLDAAIRQFQLLAAAQVVVALPEVDVGVAKSGGLDFDQHLAALRLGRGLLDQAQRLAVVGDAIATHGRVVR